MATTYLGNIRGPQGYSVVSAVVGGDDRLRFTLSTGAVIDVGNVRGAQGLPGVNAVDNDTAVAGYVSTVGTSATKTALLAGFAGQVAAGVTIPVSTSFADIQAAADTAATNGTRLWAAGIVITSSTLVIKSDADLSGLTINYTGVGIAVQVGAGTSGTRLDRARIVLPRVVNSSKVSAGWTAGTVGVKVINVNACYITVPHVRGFATGLQVTGVGAGAIHTTFDLGHLDNNKVNILIDADATGWSNQNIYLGGKLSHDSVEGLNIAGCRQIKMTAGLPSAPNNNLFANTSVEWGAAEYHLDVAGASNQFQNLRYEVTGGARVRWQSDATDNQILYGYKSGTIVQTHVAGSGRNHVFAPSGGERTSGGAIVLENTSSSSTPVEYIMDPGAVVAGAAPATAFRVKRTADATDVKRAADAFARLRLDHVNGRMYVGNGVADPTVYIGAIGSAFGVTGFATTTVAPAAGGAGALPATPAGYMTLFIDGVSRKLPYY